MKPSLAILAILSIAGAAARAQVVPDVDRPKPLPVSGTLHYDLRYSQTAQIGDGQGSQQMSIASGDASYANVGKRLPFSMQYGGGYGWVWAGRPSAGNVFQHLSLSQGFIGRAWSLTASDNVSYSFETPTTGFSGVPGSGDPIGGSGSNTTSDQTILALNTRTLDNSTTIGFTQRLNYAMGLNLGGSWGQLHFIDDSGVNMSTEAANAGVTRRLNARNSFSGQYSFSRFGYGSAGLTTETNNAQFAFTRQWKRQLTTSAGVGPIWIASSGNSGTGGISLPSSTALSLNASAIYQLRSGAAGVSYSRGTSGGAGYLLGAKINSISANYSREFGRNLTVGFTGSYNSTASLFAAELVTTCPNGSGACLYPLTYTPTTHARYGGVQATRNLGKYLTFFASYTAIDQSSGLNLTAQNTTLNYNATVLNGLNQVIGFGIGYSPRETHLKQ